MNAPVVDPAMWQRIEGYLDQALDLEPGERTTWLAQLASAQQDIAKLLRELLADLDTADELHFLEGSALKLIDPACAEPVSMVGRCLGAYTIQSILGHGGMGEVWLASSSDGHSEGRCAIKLLDRRLEQPDRAERFRGEGRMLARLTHPNIARLIDAGTAADGRYYLAIEYVDGERIDHYCQARKLDVNARVRLFLGVVGAVAYAHTRLIIHCDLKPSNVFVTRDGTVKLLDFGIAKLLSADPFHGDPAVTCFEEMALTPEYAAPEQLLCETPSTATDVYQLGMLLYVLLAGRHPLPQYATRAERIKTALEWQIPRASDIAARDIARTLRGELDAILAMSLRKEPRERYATALALGEDLQRFLNREPIHARREDGARKFADCGCPSGVTFFTQSA